MKFPDYKPILLSLALYSGCYTYSEDIKIWDSEGNIYRKPRKESSYEMQRNEPETIAIIPKGRHGFAIFEYVDGEGIKRKGKIRLDPKKNYVFRRTTDGDLWFLERRSDDVEK